MACAFRLLLLLLSDARVSGCCCCCWTRRQFHWQQPDLMLVASYWCQGGRRYCRPAATASTVATSVVWEKATVMLSLARRVVHWCNGRISGLQVSGDLKN
jgi:hypothetical protein